MSAAKTRKYACVCVRTLAFMRESPLICEDGKSVLKSCHAILVIWGHVHARKYTCTHIRMRTEEAEGKEGRRGMGEEKEDARVHTHKRMHSDPMTRLRT